jgi:hypothetical protein
MGGSGDDPVHVENNGIELIRGNSMAIGGHDVLPEFKVMIIVTIQYISKCMWSAAIARDQRCHLTSHKQQLQTTRCAVE